MKYIMAGLFGDTIKYYCNALLTVKLIIIME